MGVTLRKKIFCDERIKVNDGLPTFEKNVKHTQEDVK